MEFYKKITVCLLMGFSILAVANQTTTPEAITESVKALQDTTAEPKRNPANDNQSELNTFFVKEGSKDLSNTFYNEQFIELGLEYPLNFGVHLRYLLNDTVYVRLGVGFMPSLFLNSFKELAPSLGYLKEEESKLIANTFENSMYLDFRLAWSPYLKDSGGPYLEIGASSIFYGSGILSGSTLSKVLVNDEFDESKKYTTKTNTYNATAHVGYQIPFEKLKLNLEVGVIKILASSVLDIEPMKTLNAPKRLTLRQEKNFTNFLRKKGWIFPTISAWVSFAF